MYREHYGGHEYQCYGVKRFQNPTEPAEKIQVWSLLRTFQINIFAFLSELREEMRPDELPDVSEVENFDATKLKRVKTKESNVLPTKEGK